MQRQGRNSEETIMQPWGRVLVPLQGIYITISLSCFEDTETPTRWKQLTGCPQAREPQTSWNQKVDDADSHLPHHQPIRRMSMNWSHLLWTITIKFLTTPSRSGHTVLRALALCLAKQWSYSFLFHPKLCLQDLIQCWGTEAGFSITGTTVDLCIRLAVQCQTTLIELLQGLDGSIQVPGLKSSLHVVSTQSLLDLIAMVY